MSPDPLRANKYHNHITPGPSHVCSETLDKTVSFACICTHGPVLANHIHNQENICSHTHQLLLFCPLQVVTELMALQVHQSISGCGVVAVELIVSYNKTWLVGAYVAQGAAVMCTNSWCTVAFVSICSNTHAHTHTYIHVYILIFLKGIDDGSTQTQLTYSVAGLLVCAEKALHNQGTETNQTRDRKAKPRHNCRNPLLPNPMYPELMSTPSTTPANTFLIFCAPADRCCSIIAAQKWRVPLRNDECNCESVQYNRNMHTCCYAYKLSSLRARVYDRVILLSYPLHTIAFISSYFTSAEHTHTGTRTRVPHTYSCAPERPPSLSLVSHTHTHVVHYNLECCRENGPSAIHHFSSVSSLLEP